MDYWLTGAGPGTFTRASSITIDISRRFPQGDGYLQTPHNMFIAVFGEVGFFGLIAFVVPLLATAYVLPFLDRRPSALVAGSMTFAVIVAGIAETREVFGTGLGSFLVVCTFAAYLKELHAAKKADPSLEPQSA